MPRWPPLKSDTRFKFYASLGGWSVDLCCEPWNIEALWALIWPEYMTQEQWKKKGWWWVVKYLSLWVIRDQKWYSLVGIPIMQQVSGAPKIDGFSIWDWGNLPHKSWNIHVRLVWGVFSQYMQLYHILKVVGGGSVPKFMLRSTTGISFQELPWKDLVRHTQFVSVNAVGFKNWYVVQMIDEVD